MALTSLPTFGYSSNGEITLKPLLIGSAITQPIILVLSIAKYTCNKKNKSQKSEKEIK